MGVKRNTKRTGDISEAMAIAALVQSGYDISIPFGENHRYDLIAEKDRTFYRVQVKTGRVRSGVLKFNCYSSHAHRGGPSCRLYTDEVDFFAVCCLELRRVFLVPLSEQKTYQGFLRLEPTKNGQKSKIRWAWPYALNAELPLLVGTGGAPGVPTGAMPL